MDYRLLDDATMHLTDPKFALYKLDGHLLEDKSCPVGQVFHPDLKGIAHKPDLVQVKCFQDFTPIADKSRGWVHDGHTSDNPRIY